VDLMSAGGIPTVRTVDHVGLTVPDLAAGIRFFVDALGFDEVYTHAPAGSSGEVQERQFARHRDTRIVGIAMLRLGTLNLELFEFSAPDQRREVPRTSDWGGAHLAFYVDDIDAAVEHLRAHGARVLGEPMDLPGPEAGPGNRFVFALAPGDIPIELISYAGGKAYERQSGGQRLFDPREQPRWHDATS
jgi:catechol 2,3-dioxygenase-like lactoylglutathione lyase family enzyme